MRALGMGELAMKVQNLPRYEYHVSAAGRISDISNNTVGWLGNMPSPASKDREAAHA